MTGFCTPFRRKPRRMSLSQRVAVLETQMETMMSDLQDLQDTAKRLVDENTQALADMDEAKTVMADATARLRAAADANDIVTIRQVTAELAEAAGNMHSGAQALHQSSQAFEDLHDQAQNTDAPPADTLVGGQGNDTLFGGQGDGSLAGSSTINAGSDTLQGGQPVNGGLDGVTNTQSSDVRTTSDASTGTNPATTSSIPNNSSRNPAVAPADPADGHAVADPGAVIPDAGSPAISPDIDRTTADVDAEAQNQRSVAHPLDHDTTAA